MRDQPDYAPGYAGGTRAVLELLARAALGADPRQVELVRARMDAAAKGYAYAKSALDIACWDLFGRATGLRVSDLLGGTFQEEFPLYTGIGIGEPEAMRSGCGGARRRLPARSRSRWGPVGATTSSAIGPALEVLGGRAA